MHEWKQLSRSTVNWLKSVLINIFGMAWRVSYAGDTAYWPHCNHTHDVACFSISFSPLFAEHVNKDVISQSSSWDEIIMFSHVSCLCCYIQRISTGVDSDDNIATLSSLGNNVSITKTHQHDHRLLSYVYHENNMDNISSNLSQSNLNTLGIVKRTHKEA